MLSELSQRLIQLVSAIHEGLLAHHRDVLRQLLVQVSELQKSADEQRLPALSAEFAQIMTRVDEAIAKL